MIKWYDSKTLDLFNKFEEMRRKGLPNHYVKLHAANSNTKTFGRFDIWIDNDLTFGNKENNKFCAIFFKIAKGDATKSEIRFAKKYAKDYSAYLNSK